MHTMKKFPSNLVLAIFLCANLALGITDTLVGVSCFPDSPLTAMPQCDYFTNATNVCDDLSVQERLICFCNQRFFDSLIGCESEDRLCFMNDGLDNEWQAAATAWHTFCDTYLTFSPTTPHLSTLSTSYVESACEDIESACESARASFDKCSTFTTDVTQFSSCACQSDIQTWDYSCEYLGNISCFETGAALSNLFAYTLRDNFEQVIGSGLESGFVSKNLCVFLTEQTTPSVMTVTLPPSTSSSQASPQAAASTTPAPTSTSTITITPTSAPTPTPTTPKSLASKLSKSKFLSNPLVIILPLLLYHFVL